MEEITFPIDISNLDGREKKRSVNPEKLWLEPGNLASFCTRCGGEPSVPKKMELSGDVSLKGSQKIIKAVIPTLLFGFLYFFIRNSGLAILLGQDGFWLVFVLFFMVTIYCWKYFLMSKTPDYFSYYLVYRLCSSCARRSRNFDLFAFPLAVLAGLWVLGGVFILIVLFEDRNWGIILPTALSLPLAVVLAWFLARKSTALQRGFDARLLADQSAFVLKFDNPNLVSKISGPSTVRPRTNEKLIGRVRRHVSSIKRPRGDR